MEGGTITIMETILTAIEDIAESFAGMVGQWVAIPTATGNGLLLFFVLLPIFGVGVGLISRLVNAFK